MQKRSQTESSAPERWEADSATATFPLETLFQFYMPRKTDCRRNAERRKKPRSPIRLTRSPRVRVREKGCRLIVESCVVFLCTIFVWRQQIAILGRPSVWNLFTVANNFNHTQLHKGTVDNRSLGFAQTGMR